MTALRLSQSSSNPILPATNEAVWGVLSVVLLAVVVLALVLATRYVSGVRRAANLAAERAAAAEAEVRALREELRGRSS